MCTTVPKQSRAAAGPKRVIIRPYCFTDSTRSVGFRRRRSGNRTDARTFLRRRDTKKNSVDILATYSASPICHRNINVSESRARRVWAVKNEWRNLLGRNSAFASTPTGNLIILCARARSRLGFLSFSFCFLVFVSVLFRGTDNARNR